MSNLTPETITAGSIAIALIGALITVIKIHDKRVSALVKEHQEEMKQMRSEAAAQTMVVIGAVKDEATSKEKLAQSIDELKNQQRESTGIQRESMDKLTTAFYAILTQKNP